MLLPTQEQWFPFQKISLELLPQLASDLIFVQAYKTRKPPNQLTDAKDLDNYHLKGILQESNNNAIAQSMRASQQGRVYFIPATMCGAVARPIGAELFFNQLSQQLLPPN